MGDVVIAFAFAYRVVGKDNEVADSMVVAVKNGGEGVAQSAGGKVIVGVKADRHPAAVAAAV